MILYNVLQVRCRHFEYVLVQVLPPERSLRHGECGLQEAIISNPIDAPVCLDEAQM